MADSRRILVHPRQRGNPILGSVTNVPYEFTEIVADFQIGKSTSVFFLSLRYHALKPEYIHDRLKEAGRFPASTVLLLLVDSKDLDNLFNEINKICVLAGISLLMAFSNEEAAQYLELLKLNESKPPDALMGKRPTDLLSAAVDFLTSIRPINKSDAVSLIKAFKTVNNILLADKKALSIVPGLGQRKVDALFKALHSDAASKGKGTKQTLVSQFFSSSQGTTSKEKDSVACSIALTTTVDLTVADDSNSTASVNVYDSDPLGFVESEHEESQ